MSKKPKLVKSAVDPFVELTADERHKLPLAVGFTDKGMADGLAATRNPAVTRIKEVTAYLEKIPTDHPAILSHPPPPIYL